jgi:hypothetical protein
MKNRDRLEGEYSNSMLPYILGNNRNHPAQDPEVSVHSSSILQPWEANSTRPAPRAGPAFAPQFARPSFRYPKCTLPSKARDNFREIQNRTERLGAICRSPNVNDPAMCRYPRTNQDCRMETAEINAKRILAHRHPIEDGEAKSRERR